MSGRPLPAPDTPRAGASGASAVGFTLPELLVGAVGMMILGTVILVSFYVTLRGLMILNGHYALVASLQSASEQLERDIHFAKGRLSDGTACAGYTAGLAVLILDAPGIGGPGIDKVIYQAPAATLQRILQNTGCSLASPSIRNLTPKPVRNVVVLFTPTTLSGAVITRILAKSTVGQHTTTGKLVVRYNFRNP